MERGNFNDFEDAIGKYHSSNRHDAVDSSNRLGRYALDEFKLERIGMVKKDKNFFDNDYGGGWTGKYGINSKEEFLASPEAQEKAFEAVLGWLDWHLWGVDHYDGQIINGQEISMSGIFGAAYVNSTFAVSQYFSDGDFKASVNESLARYNGYMMPFQVNPNGSHSFVGSQGADKFRGYAGDDWFLPSAGDDKIDGAEGEDTVILDHKRSDYMFSQGADAVTWQISRKLADGSEEHKEIKNIELVRFWEDDQKIDLRGAPARMPSELPDITLDFEWESSGTASDLDPVSGMSDLPADPVTCSPEESIPRRDVSDALPATKTTSTAFSNPLPEVSTETNRITRPAAVPQATSDVAPEVTDLTVSRVGVGVDDVEAHVPVT